MNKTVIYGSTSAIAEKFIELSLKKGNPVHLIARNSEKLENQITDLKVRFDSLKEQITGEAVDFNNNEVLRTSFPTAVQSLGECDTVLIAHGSLPNQNNLENAWSQAEQEFQTNLMSVLALSHEVGNYFAEKGTGTLAVISSVAGDRGRQSNYYYGTSKGAVSIFLQGLRSRLAKKGAHVVDIKPGFVDTPMTADFKKGPLWVKPEQIAAGIHSAIEKQKDTVYLPFFWLGIMTIIKLIPEKIFKKLNL